MYTFNPFGQNKTGYSYNGNSSMNLSGLSEVSNVSRVSNVNEFVTTSNNNLYLENFVDDNLDSYVDDNLENDKNVSALASEVSGYDKSLDVKQEIQEINNMGLNNQNQSTLPLMEDEDSYVKPRNLDSYILEKLGQGGQGTVYKATIKGTDTVIALKTIQLKDSSIIEAAKIELENLIEISKAGCFPFIVCYYNDFFDPLRNMILIEMEYINGKDLNKWCLPYRQKSLYTALYKHLISITTDITRAIEFVHRHNIIHRDIKPQNIVINSQNVPKLIDFGLGCIPQVCSVAPTVNFTCCPGRDGTPIYMSPEAVREPSKSYYASDIWSLGVTLFAVATGKVPYRNVDTGSIKEIFNAIVTQLPSILSTSNRLLNLLVNSMLQEDPVLRPKPITILDYIEKYKD